MTEHQRKKTLQMAQQSILMGASLLSRLAAEDRRIAAHAGESMQSRDRKAFRRLAQAEALEAVAEELKRLQLQ